MKMVAIAALSCALGMAGVNSVERPAMATVEKVMDGQLQSLWPEDALLLLGTTRGLCLDGYGAVFTAELNLVAAPPRTPMSLPVPDKETIERFHAKKMERVAKLRDSLRTILARTAGSLDKLPPDEQVVIGVTLIRYSWENTSGIPTHIVMQGRRSDLMQNQAAGPAALQQVIKVEEY